MGLLQAYRLYPDIYPETLSIASYTISLFLVFWYPAGVDIGAEPAKSYEVAPTFEAFLQKIRTWGDA
jgi:hypothetical protein